MINETIFTIITAVTCYNPCPEQGWGDGTITADGSKIPESVNVNWVAISHDLFKAGIQYGDTINWNGIDYIVKDKMNKRWVRRIDVLQHKDKKIFKHTNQPIIIKPKEKGNINSSIIFKTLSYEDDFKALLLQGGNLFEES